MSCFASISAPPRTPCARIRIPVAANLSFTTASTLSFDACGLMKTKARFVFTAASTVAPSQDGAAPIF